MNDKMLDKAWTPDGGMKLINNGVYIQRNKTRSIANDLLSPHYNDKRFRQRRYDGKVGERVKITVFLNQKLNEKKLTGNQQIPPSFGLHYEYADRLVQHYGQEKIDSAWDEVNKLGLQPGSAAEYEAYLRLVTNNNSINLKQIISYVLPDGNWGRIYGYSRK